jgi:hypothetical protein
MADALAAALQKRKEKVSRSGTYFLAVGCGENRLLTVIQMMKTRMMTGRGGTEWTKGLKVLICAMEIMRWRIDS